MKKPSLWTNYGHEIASFLAFALLAGTGETPFFQVRLATPHEDKHQGTDLFLYRGGGNKRIIGLRLDLTTGFRVLEKKRDRNEELRREVEMGKRERSYSVLPMQYPNISPDPRFDPCFTDAWDRLVTYKPVAFSPQHICPRHGVGCPLVEKLLAVGWQMVGSLPKDFQPEGYQALSA